MGGGAEASAESSGIGRVALGGVLLAVALVLAWVPIGADVQRTERVPPAAAVKAATDLIRAEFKAGDAVVVVPSWFQDPWRALQMMGPGTEAWPFPALFPSEDLDLLDALAFERLWVLSTFDRPPEPPGLLPSELRARTDFALPVTGDGVTGDGVTGPTGVALARYDLAGVRRLRTMSRELGQLEVARGWGGPLEPCKASADQVRCGHEGWYDIWVEDHIVYHQHVRWPYTHPGPRGPLEITWRRLQAAASPAQGGASTWLVVRAGFTQQAVRQPEGKAVTVTVAVGGREVDTFELAPHRYWMERRAIRLQAYASDTGRVDVTLRLVTEDNGWRETMMEVDVLDRLPESLRAWATQVIE